MSAYPFGLEKSDFPIKAKSLRKILANEPHGICPECGGDVDTGWECNDCQFDARPEAYPEYAQGRQTP